MVKHKKKIWETTTNCRSFCNGAKYNVPMFKNIKQKGKKIIITTIRQRVLTTCSLGGAMAHRPEGRM